MPMKLSVGPILYYWSREKTLQFYAELAGAPVEVVYLGEIVCAKRRAMRREDWTDVAELLRSAGKQVVFSTLTLIEAQSELHAVERWCETGSDLIEANDMAAVAYCAERQRPFVSGPHINLYNARSLRVLQQDGLQRMVMPLEMSGEHLSALLSEIRQLGGSVPEVEVFAWGRMPLAHSARCFAARHHQRSKDDCGFVCQDYPDGILLRTQEQQPLFTLNGIQTQSSRILNLLPALPDLRERGVSLLRLSPQAENMAAVIAAFDAARRDLPTPALPAESAQQSCDGFWYGKAGMERRMEWN